MSTKRAAMESRNANQQAQLDAEGSSQNSPTLAPKPKKAKSVQQRLPVASVASAPQTHENGVILEIMLTNFMNHSHLKLELDPHVNFIVGKNGSGKSAIVASLVAGFGVKAKSTGRNTNTTKSLIRHGQPEATIEIHIANGGADHFHADEFGATIIVETKLTRIGSTTYRLSGASGFSQ